MILRKRFVVKSEGLIGLLYDVPYRLKDQSTIVIDDSAFGCKRRLASSSHKAQADDSCSQNASKNAVELKVLANHKAKQRQDERTPKTFTLRRANTYWVLSHLTQYDDPKARRLAVPILSFMLAIGNVASDRRVLVVDGTAGILIGACLERGADVTPLVDNANSLELLHRMNVRGVHCTPVTRATISGEYDS